MPGLGSFMAPHASFLPLVMQSFKFSIDSFSNNSEKNLEAIFPEFPLADIKSFFFRSLIFESISLKGVRLIKRFRARRGKLNDKRKKIKNDPERYDLLTAEIESLDSAVQNLRVGGGIGELFYSAAGKMQVLSQKEGVDQEFLDDGSANPDFMGWEELNEMTEIFKLYSGIIGNIF